MGESAFIDDAVKIFNQAFSNKIFRKQLLAKLKSAQETLEGAAKVLKNSDEVKMAVDRAAELGKIIEVLKK